MFAAMGGFSDILEGLITRGAALNIQTRVPLYYHMFVNVILTIDRLMRLSEQTGSTAMIFACQHGHAECTQILLKHGAKFDVVDRVCTPNK